jgi:hypothetical protein
VKRILFPVIFIFICLDLLAGNLPEITQGHNASISLTQTSSDYYSSGSVRTLAGMRIIFPEIRYGDNASVSATQTAGEYYYGGSARMAALGGMQIVVPDITNTLDLYDAGFAAGAVFRPRKNMVYLSPEFNYYPDRWQYQDSQSKTSGFQLASNLRDEPAGGIFVWLSDESAVIFKPYFLMDASANSGTKLFNLLYAGDLEFAQKIFDIFSFGASAGYESYILDNKQPDPYITLEDKETMSRFEYALSGACELKNSGYSLTFALSAGRKGNVYPFLTGYDAYDYKMAAFPIGNFVSSPDAVFFNNNDFNIYLKEFIFNPELEITELYSFYKSNSFDLDGAVGFKVPEKFEIIFSGGPLLGMRWEQTSGYTLTTDMLPGNTMTTRTDFGGQRDAYNGNGAHLSLGTRYITGNITLGCRANFLYMDYNTDTHTPGESPNDDRFINFQGAAGMSIKLSSIDLPFEIALKQEFFEVKQASGDYIYHSDIECIRGGIEYSLSDLCVLRGGADFSIGESMTNIFAGNWFDCNRAGINAGIGFKIGEYELNAALRYAYIYRVKTARDIFNEISLKTDLKKYF